MTRKYPLLKITLYSSIIGLFIPGFTAIVLTGFQSLLGKMGIECAAATKGIWLSTTIIAICLPFIFDRKIIKTRKRKEYRVQKLLPVFNLIEYTSLQASLAALFTDAETLCYVSDGQNGMELIFTAWLSLPILIAISYAFDYRSKNNTPTGAGLP
ncbi:MAG: hypothetical protein JNL72_04845 [Flavipsychrobacter sp.]|nr:hypothetical protein [Flavipsychrobacter sp.]